MKGKGISLIAIAGILLLFASVGFADSPVRQDLGLYDTVYGELEESDCRVCHDFTTETNVNRHHLLYGSVIPATSVVPNPDADGDSIPDTNYGCLNCHDQDTSGGVITFLVPRDCTACHTSKPHHVLPAALAGDCVSCHGDLVDNEDDGHYIPTYAASLVTPAPGHPPPRTG